MKKSYNSTFKFKVVMEVISGDLTIAQIMSKYKVSKSVIHKWKKHFLENGSGIFTNKANSVNEEISTERLHATIGKLIVERDFLQSAWQKLKR